jgi:hypothetical protein
MVKQFKYPKEDKQGMYKVFNGHRYHCAGGANTIKRANEFKESPYFCTRVTKNDFPDANTKYILWLGPRKKNAPK